MDNYTLYWAHLSEHTDPKTQGYIGITKSFATRRRRHLSDAKSENNKCIHFANAIRYYGEDSIIFDVLKEEVCEELACFLEELYRPTRNIGWNISIGGMINVRFGEDHQYYGKIRDKETREKISQTCIERSHSVGSKNPNADHTLYTFKHPDHPTEVTTRYDFEQKWGFTLKPLFRKKNPTKTRKGWSIW